MVSQKNGKFLYIGFAIVLSLALILVVAILGGCSGRGRLSVPTNLRQYELTLHWDEVSGASGYVVRVDGTEHQIDMNMFSPDLTSAGEYLVSVKAVHPNESRSSAFSPEFSFIIYRNIIRVNTIADVEIEKEFDGTTAFYGQLERGIHYELNATSNVDITFTTIAFNSANVDATHLYAEFNTVLKGADADDYMIVSGALSIPARINPQHIIEELKLPLSTPIRHGRSLSQSQLSYSNTQGSFAWQSPNYVPTASGNFYVEFTPHDTTNFDWSSISLRGQVFVELYNAVNFVTNGGSAINDIATNSLTVSPETVRAGFVFEGWYTESSFINRASFPLEVNGHITLYASWRARGLIFNLINNGTAYSVQGDLSDNRAHIEIPAEYRGLPVAEIVTSGFRGNTYLESIVIPSSVVVIGADAFGDATNLLNIFVLNYSNNVEQGANWNSTGNHLTQTHFNIIPNFTAPTVNLVANVIEYYLISDGEEINLTRFFEINSHGLPYLLTVTGDNVTGTTLSVLNLAQSFTITLQVTGLFDTVTRSFVINIHPFVGANIILLPGASNVFTNDTIATLTLDTFVSDIEIIGISPSDARVLFFVNGEEVISDITVGLGSHSVIIEVWLGTAQILTQSQFSIYVAVSSEATATITQIQNTITTETATTLISILEIVEIELSGAVVGETYLIIYHNDVRHTNVSEFVLSVGDNDFVISVRLWASDEEIGRKSLTLYVSYRLPLHAHITSIFIDGTQHFIINGAIILTGAELREIVTLSHNATAVNIQFVNNNPTLVYGANVIGLTVNHIHNYEITIYNLYVVSLFVTGGAYDSFDIIRDGNNYTLQLPQGTVLDISRIVLDLNPAYTQGIIYSVGTVNRINDYRYSVQIIFSFDGRQIGTITLTVIIGTEPSSLVNLVDGVSINAVNNPLTIIRHFEIVTIMHGMAGATPTVSLRIIGGGGYSFDMRPLAFGRNVFALTVAGYENYTLIIYLLEELTHIYYDRTLFNANADGNFVVNIAGLNSLNSADITFPFSSYISPQVSVSSVMFQTNIVALNYTVRLHGLLVYSFSVLLYNNDTLARLTVNWEQVANQHNTFVFEYTFDKFAPSEYLRLQIFTSPTSELSSDIPFVRANNIFSFNYGLAHLSDIASTYQSSIIFTVTAINGETTTYTIKLNITILELELGEHLFSILFESQSIDIYEMELEIGVVRGIFSLSFWTNEVTLTIDSTEFSFIDTTFARVSTITVRPIFDRFIGRHMVGLLVVDGNNEKFTLWLTFDKEELYIEGNQVIMALRINGQSFHFIECEEQIIDIGGHYVLAALETFDLEAIYTLTAYGLLADLLYDNPWYELKYEVVGDYLIISLYDQINGDSIPILAIRLESVK